MKIKKRLFIGISMFMVFLVLVFLVKSESTQIGYEYVENGEFLHTWNQNPLGEAESNIWQNVSANYLQFYNGEDLDEARDRSTWLKNNFLVGYYSQENFVIFSPQNFFESPQNQIESDNQTYWNQTLQDCVGDAFCAGWHRGQELYSEYMENSLFWDFRGVAQPQQQLYYVWKFENIQIENDDIIDYIEYCAIINYQERCNHIQLDSSEEIEVTNLTNFFIMDSETRRGHEIIWNKTTDVRLRYEGDGNVMLLSPINNIGGYDEIKMWWIDAESDKIDPDATLMQSGYILEISGLPTYRAFNNTPIKSGRPHISGMNVNWTKGFVSFNLSDIPDDANVTSVSIYSGISACTPTAPDDWKTAFEVGTTDINDNGGLEAGDWGDGTNAVTIDWSDADKCNGNEPCYIWIVLGTGEGNIAVDTVKDAIANNTWWYSVFEDASLYSDGQQWECTWKLTGKGKVQLEVNYTYIVQNETQARQAILEGIDNSAPTSIEYQDQQIYTVTLGGTQTTGYFDVVAVLNNQTWAFNYLTGSESYTNVNSLLNIVNVWENTSLQYEEIVSQVEVLINETLI